MDRPGSRKTHSPLVLVEKHHQKLPRSETQSSKKLRRSSSTAQLALRLRTVHPTHRWKPWTASSSATEHEKTRSGFRRRTRRFYPTNFRFHSVWTEATQPNHEPSFSESTKIHTTASVNPREKKKRTKENQTTRFGYQYLSFVCVTDWNSEELLLSRFMKRGMTESASQAGEEVLLVAALSPGRTGVERFGPERVKFVGKLGREAESGVELRVIHGWRERESEAKQRFEEGKGVWEESEKVMKPLRFTRVMKGNEEVEVAGWGRFNNDPAVCAEWDPHSKWKRKKKKRIVVSWRIIECKKTSCFY